VRWVYISVAKIRTDTDRSMLHCTPPEHGDAPTPGEFRVVDGEWRCDLDAYRAFLEAVAGTSDGIDCGDDDCYVVGSRLEGFIEQRRSDGEWTEDLPDRYPDVESLAEIEALALFFRTCHADARSVEPPAEF
jgi:hypothetical protein